MNEKTSKILLAVGTIVIVSLLFLNQKKNNEIKDLREFIDNERQLNQEIKKRLLELLENNKDIDPEIVNELTSIASLLEIKQETKALLSLAKIIEKLLKELYKKDQAFKEKYKRPTFSDYLEFAKINRIISADDFHLLEVLRLIRNQEAHELNVKKEHSKIAASFITGIAFVLTLTDIIKEKSTASHLIE